MGARTAFALGASLLAATQALAEDITDIPDHIDPQSAYGILTQQYYGEPLDYIYKDPYETRPTSGRYQHLTIEDNVILSALAQGNSGGVETIAAKPYELGLNEESTFHGYIFSTYSPLDRKIGLHVIGCDFVSDERNSETVVQILDITSINTHVNGNEAVEYCSDKAQPDIAFNIVHSFFDIRTPTMAAIIHGIENSGEIEDEPEVYNPDPLESDSFVEWQYAYPAQEAG